MKTKKAIAVLMMAAMTVGMLAGCGDESAAGNGNDKTDAGSAASGAEAAATADDGEVDLSGTKITFLNSKGEVQTALEEMADAFYEETGIEVEILACGTGESPYT